MNHSYPELEIRSSPTTLLGYLNFSQGQPDPRWQRAFHDAFVYFAEGGETEPWHTLVQWLREQLASLHQSESSAFREIKQAEAALDAFELLLPAYREHHRLLLAHLSDQELFKPFLLVRFMEASLAEEPASNPPELVVRGALTRLNDFVGYRPIAILETRPEAEPYAHECIRPSPLYLREVGVAAGPYHDLIRATIEILKSTDPDILFAAHLDVDLLDELALDVRAYDHGHPANRRPNYIFGEWDPHHLDNQGRHRRFIARRIVLDALLERALRNQDRDPEEILFELAAVLAGTILMGSGVSGRSPTAHDSSQSLATLMPSIAQYRDAFYQQLMDKLPEKHANHLRAEQATTRQAFGSTRQYLNAYLAQHRARQLQHRYLTVLFAEMGYPEAGHEEARKIPTASVRVLSEILGMIGAARFDMERGELERAAKHLPEIERLLLRGIECGAVADPWNILGFQGLFPLSSAQEDSVRDTRLEELLQMIEQILHLYSRLAGECAAVGEDGLAKDLSANLERFAEWWDRYATIEVADVKRISGREASQSTKSVVEALAHWRRAGRQKADMAVWREHLGTFHSPHAFALVVDALLKKNDYAAALALLVNWIGHVEQAPLEDGPYSFHTLAIRWMLGATRAEDASKENLEVIRKFFAFLEANAEEYWEVPRTEKEGGHLSSEHEEPDEEEDVFSAAYENVTYKDSTGGEDEGAVVDGSQAAQEIPLAEDAPRLQKRLRFHSTLARLWQLASRGLSAKPGATQPLIEEIFQRSGTVEQWLKQACSNRNALLALMDEVHQQPLPKTVGSFDSLVEHDRNRVIKEQLLQTIIEVTLEMILAIGAMRALQPDLVEEAPVRQEDLPPVWEAEVLRMERAFFRGNAAEAQSAFRDFVKLFREEPLLTVSLSDGGHPRRILRSHLAQIVLRSLLANLPRLGLLQETFELLTLARRMEQQQVLEQRGITEWNQLFHTAFGEVMETVVHSFESWEPRPVDSELVVQLNRLTTPFLKLWIDHSRSVQLDPIEAVRDEEDWAKLLDFIRRYGEDFFHARFMTPANLRGILHHGIEPYLDYLQENPESLEGPAVRKSPFEQPTIRLLEDMGRTVERKDAVRWLTVILQSVLTHFKEYKDYNSSSSQSDYGSNLHILLDQLRIKSTYNRQAWHLSPLLRAHEALARHGCTSVARLWEETLERTTGELADEHLAALQALEQKHGTRLRTVRDRLEERFIKQLSLDRLRSMIEPALQSGGKSEKESRDAALMFHQFREELRHYTDQPVGVGLDVPEWLRSLEEEVRRARANDSGLLGLTDHGQWTERKSISWEHLMQLLDHWEGANKE